MELKTLTTYTSANNSLKIIAIASIVALIFVTTILFIFSWTQLEKSKNVIYVIDQKGSVTEAVATELNMEIRQYEYEDHVKDFYTLWYAFDQNSFKRNIDKALLLIGESGKELYNEYKAQDIESMLRSKNIQTKVRITEIKIDITQRPVRGYIKGVQTISRLNGEVARNMNCTFSIYDINRSRDNSHGCLIEDWKVVDNTQISSE